METLVLDGKKIAADLRAEMTAETARLKKEHDLVPGLGVVLVGEDPASVSYVTGKQKAADEIGIYSEEHRRPADFPEADLLALVEQLNKDPRIHGILVQLPLPKHIDETKVLYNINPDKDVDGFHPVSLGRLMIGTPGFLPCTPHGVQQMLLRSNIEVARKHVVVVGRSNIVGKPVANILLQKQPGANATVTICHTGTKDIGEFTRQADIVIVAAGRPDTLTADMVREGAVVVDVGVNRIPDDTKKKGFRLVGDADFEGLKDKVSAITPVPGGVGPMTITMLMYNTIESAKRAANVK